MPIFHLSVRTLSRSTGRSAVAAAAYRAGARLRCDRTGQVFDYSRRHGVVTRQVVVTQSETTISRQQLWNRAEAAETRSNSTVAREFEIALPSELDAAAREALAVSFAEALAARYRIAVDVAIHAPSGQGDVRNHHAHVLTSTRTWNAGAFDRKVRLLDDRCAGPAEITAVRAMWAEMANAALMAAGMTDTIDHRSHYARDIAEAPGQKLGPAAVGLERRTGMVSRRRADQNAERATLKQSTPAPAESKDSIGTGQAESDRRRAQRLVLSGLRSTFTAATAAVMAGRAHPALQGIPMSISSERRLTPAASIHRSTARWSSSPLQIRSSAPVARGIPAPQIGKGTRRVYDEEAEAAAMYRRVDRELDAERRAQMAEQEAEARRAGSLGGFQCLTGALGIGIGLAHAPPLPGSARRGRADHRGTGSTRRPASDEHAPRPISERHHAQPAVDVEPPTADAPTTENLARRALAIMLAQELGRRHKRSRVRLCRLAAAAGSDEAAFAAAVVARDEITFDPVAVAGDPMLAAIWDAWEQEDRVKQRVRQDEVDAPPPPTVVEVTQPATPSVEAEPQSAGPVDVEKRAGADIAATKKRPYRRRDLVVDHAILVMARNGWSKDVGDALAGLLRTQRDWVWSEAHRVCRARYRAARPQDVLGEHLRTISRAVIAGAEKDPQARKVIRAIDRGLIGRGLG